MMEERKAVFNSPDLILGEEQQSSSEDSFSVHSLSAEEVSQGELPSEEEEVRERIGDAQLEEAPVEHEEASVEHKELLPTEGHDQQQSDVVEDERGVCNKKNEHTLTSAQGERHYQGEQLQPINETEELGVAPSVDEAAAETQQEERHFQPIGEETVLDAQETEGSLSKEQLPASTHQPNVLDFLNDLLFFRSERLDETIEESTQKDEAQQLKQSLSAAEPIEITRARVMEELKATLEQLYTGNHRILESVARRPVSSPERKQANDARFKECMDRVVLELDAIVSDFYTDHHEVVEGYGNAGMAQRRRHIPRHEQMDLVIHQLRTEGVPPLKAAPVKPDAANDAPLIKQADFRKEVTNSLTVFEALLQSRSTDEDDDCWTECTVETGVVHKNLIVGNDDDDCWTEYTVEASAAAPALAENVENPIARTASADSDDFYDCEDSYTEHTIDESDGMEHSNGDEYTIEETLQKPIRSTTTTSTQAQDVIALTQAEFRRSRMFSDFSQQPQQDVLEIVENTGAPDAPSLDDEDLTECEEDDHCSDSLPQSFTITLTASTPPHDGQLKSEETERTGSISDDDDDENSECSHRDASPASPSSPGAAASNRTAELLRKDIWSRDPAVVYAALHDLSKEAGRGSRSSIVRLGGLLAIIRAMTSHITVADIQITACLALERLAQDQDTRRAIGEVGGVHSIVLVMQEHLDDIAVQQAACSALVKLTNYFDTDRIPADRAVETVAKSMARHADHHALQEQAFRTLANLCLDNRERLQELSDVGGLATMTVALQRPWANHSEKHEAISQLSMLLRGLAECHQ